MSAFVLKGGTNNLMDSGERGKLLNHIAEQMRILRGIAYGMDRAMYWAKDQWYISVRPEPLGGMAE